MRILTVAAVLLLTSACSSAGFEVAGTSPDGDSGQSVEADDGHPSETAPEHDTGQAPDTGLGHDSAATDACVPVPKGAACGSKTCGPVVDGCGGAYDCGSCPSGSGCGADGACACVPKSKAEACGSLGCGAPSDGCGGEVACGSCSLDYSCGYKTPFVCDKCDKADPIAFSCPPEFPYGRWCSSGYVNPNCVKSAGSTAKGYCCTTAA